MKIDLNDRVAFEERHNGPDEIQVSEMLHAIGANSMEELIDQTIPSKIRMGKSLELPKALNEFEYLQYIKEIASSNKVYKSFIGQGYYNCVVPTVIQRNILENPGWYTAYTPYQAEIAQGRLEALINFQTMVIDLTGMEIANASLLDEATAAAEAMTMLFGSRKGDKKSATKFLVDKEVFPQTIDVMKTRAIPFGIDLEVVDLWNTDITASDVYGILFQYPNNQGSIKDWSSIVEAAQENSVFTACSTDLLALTLLTAPGDWGTDVVVGTSQRFGVPLGYGGPHAAFFATKENFKRAIPGRIIGASKDAHGNDAYRMALQTREQHIKRERATSNICTAQVLLAVMASMYGVYHGSEGLKKIALRTHGLAKSTAQALGEMGLKNENSTFFDTLKIKLDSSQIEQLKSTSEKSQINLRYFEDGVGISFDESHTVPDAQKVIDLFAELTGNSSSLNEEINIEFPDSLSRKTDFMTHPVFNQYHSEHELLRYMKRLENKDLSLVHSMISLGSCTMKLNATTEMVPVTWPEFGNIHPFAPQSQAKGYEKLISDLHDWLVEITGFHTVSFQPNSGAQGEYAGLMVIKSYLEGKGEGHRNIALIPSSAHGTNPASAVMSGMKVVIVQCDENGNIDTNDLKEKAKIHKENLAALMVTYPSTHGVFEEAIMEICAIIHENGGQVYMDGANMNAQVGLTSPGIIGADVCHLNLHKTFCIPHGGGGPGMGPIGVAEHLAPYLPGHIVQNENNNSAIAAAPFSSASILPISHAYIAMMGSDGLTNATQAAILNANYIATQLKDHYPILYTNEKGRNAHELIIDCRSFKKAGIEVEDIAKRLIDYGFHAPTVSFPVPGTMMIEPTESEVKEELDRFCEAMISIRKEIEEVENGLSDQQNNPLKNAPHSYKILLANEWDYPYSREKAAFPADYVRENKFWPSVSRVDNAYGDRNLVCSCLPVGEYAEEEV
jgi:glycine dehydrogenase